MKPFKTSLHILLASASVLGFLGGWATLAHSRKPIQTTQRVQPQVLEALPPLEPIPSFDSVNSNNGDFGSFIPTQRNQSEIPMFVTRGS